MIKFERVDSWIFLSIANVGRGDSPTLDKVIWAADGINKSVPSREEIEGAVNRLLSAGFIRIEGGRFVLLESGHAIINWIRQEAESVFEQWNMLAKYLNEAELPELSYTPWRLSEAEFDTAYECYRKDFSETLKRLKRGEYRRI